MPRPGVGFNAWMRMTQESTWGSFATSSPQDLKIVSEDITLEDPLQDRVSLGDPNILGTFKGRKTVGGSVTFEYLYYGFGLLLYNAFGSVSDSASDASGYYTHTYKIADPLPEGLSLRIERDVGYWDYVGMMVDSLTFNCNDLAVLQLVAGFIGKDLNAHASTSPGTADFPSDWPALPGDFSLTINGSEAPQGIQSGSVNLANSLSGDRPNIGNRTILQPVRGDWVRGTGQFVADYVATDHDANPPALDDFINGTAVALVYKYMDTDFTSRYIEITVPSAMYNAAAANVGGPGPMAMTWPWVAQYDSAEGTAIKVVTKNMTASGSG